MGKKLRKKKNKVKKKKTQKSTKTITKEILMEAARKKGVDKQTERILSVLGVNSENNAVVNMENIKKYFDYIKENVEMPCIVTGIEDLGCFGWEEYYTFGPGSEKEYEKLKKKYPSYTDEYELLSLDDDFDEEDGILVHVIRISDRKKFVLTLSDLEAVDQNSKNGQTINDYVVWFVNYK